MHARRALGIPECCARHLGSWFCAQTTSRVVSAPAVVSVHPCMPEHRVSFTQLACIPAAFPIIAVPFSAACQTRSVMTCRSGSNRSQRPPHPEHSDSRTHNSCGQRRSCCKLQLARISAPRFPQLVSTRRQPQPSHQQLPLPPRAPQRPVPQSWRLCHPPAGCRT